MTVLQALALAGGRYRPQANQTSTDPFGLKGDLQTIRQQILRSMARIARLQAEAVGAIAVTYPDTLKSSGADAATIADQENLLFVNRKVALERQLKALEALRQLYTDEIKSLTEKAAGLNNSLNINEAELQRISGLVDKGVVVASRKMDLQRESADLRTKLLDNEIEMLRARQFQSDAARNGANLQDQQASTIAKDLQDEIAALEQAKVKEIVLNNEIDAAGVSPPVASAPSVLIYKIVRELPTPQELTAAEDSLLEPGDVVKVQLADTP
jgi:vancomycin resistance protein YoaR